ncbi:MAG: preprotein translocase subunit SecG [Clostridia bacterium]|nr:preprotein translocase subunit SecG [Clostridia bacterium]
MSALQILIGVLVIISSLIIIVVVLMQQSREAGLSGAISGAADTFFGKNKGRTIEAKLEKFTKFFGIFFFVLVLAATILLLFIK